MAMAVEEMTAGSAGSAGPGGGAVKLKGRPRADVWTLFTESEHPQRLLACVCRHCGALVSHRKKSERAKSHLAKKCAPFRTQMLALADDAQRPDWFNELHVKAKRGADEAASGSSAGAGASVAKRAKTTSSTSSSNSAGAASSAPDLTAHQQEAIHERLAMHFYVTGTPFARAEEAFLLHAFRAGGRANIELPSRQQLAGELLDKCYSKLKALVERNQSRGDAEQAQSSVDGGNAVARACVALIKEIFFAPTTDACGASAANGAEASWAFEHLADFVDDCSTVVAFFTDVGDAQMKGRLERQQLAAGIEPLVLFNPQRQRHWGDLKPCLDALKRSEDLIYDLVTANEFTGGDVVSGSGQKLKPRVLEQRKHIAKIVTGGSFLDLLDKALQVLTPIHAIMAANVVAPAAADDNGHAASEPAAAAAAVPIISSGYHSFNVTLKDTLAKLSCLSPAEQACVSGLMNKQLTVLSGEDAGVAYLLDPRYLGEGMDGDERDRAEDRLFDFFHRAAGRDEDEDTEDEDRSADAADAQELDRKKEQLFQEYTTFVIKSNSVKQQGGFRYQMLLKGTKTIEQYWLTDGQLFPLLQQVALAVLSASAPSQGNGRNAAAAASESFAPSSLVTPAKASGASSTTATPQSLSSSARKNREGLNPEQLQKLAYVKTHAALMLEEAVV